MFLECKNVSIKIPIFSNNQKSFKKTIVNLFMRKNNKLTKTINTNAIAGGMIFNRNGITEIQALNNISFKLKDGDRLALVGHNGSGKTTLLRVLCGAYHPTSGSYKYLGKITSLINPNMGMDYELTGLENIKIRGLFLGLTKKEINNIIDEVINFSELGEFIHLPVRTYSSGMVLRLGFSISTAIQPEILLMDEWLSVGDKEFKNKAEKRLNSFIAKAGIIVIATHDHNLIKKICNKQILLEHGKIIKEENIII